MAVRCAPSAHGNEGVPRVRTHNRPTTLSPCCGTCSGTLGLDCDLLTASQFWIPQHMCSVYHRPRPLGALWACRAAAAPRAGASAHTTFCFTVHLTSAENGADENGSRPTFRLEPVAPEHGSYLSTGCPCDRCSLTLCLCNGLVTGPQHCPLCSVGELALTQWRSHEARDQCVTQ